MSSKIPSESKDSRVRKMFRSHGIKFASVGKGQELRTLCSRLDDKRLTNHAWLQDSADLHLHISVSLQSGFQHSQNCRETQSQREKGLSFIRI